MAKPSEIKPSQLTRAGYVYQDLMCIGMLIDWFHDPEKYQWMSIEGNKELGKIKSLDDVIGFTSSGRYELYQVKFTTDSDRDDLRLDFDWLLKKKPKGTSFIEKWSSDLERFSAQNEISIAKLITNRRPDDCLSNCLDGNKINYDLIPDDIASKILDQLGDARKARTFFESLIFEHSQKEIDDLELYLQDSLVPDHASIESWLQLRKTVERWATRKNEPSPDGRIFLTHIREILSLGAKRTISQFFEVPGGYIPPVEEFHKEIKRITSKPGCSVISGMPGMGKSTYLSFLTDQLIDQQIPVIRHHYYLSPHFIGDRITFNNAAQSLQSQIKSLYPFDFNNDKLDPEQLDTWISKAASISAESHKTLVVIIDGLDHVYRERSDISQLEHLINRIDPLKENICLLYGTQPISDEYLPNALLRSAPRDKAWIDIPAMGLDAIKSRIDFLLANEEIDVVGEGDHQTREIVEISQALLNISHGYPLHIIYSINALKLADIKVSRYGVERLPECPDGDIHTYYENLWVRLSQSAKEILLLIANADFSWPDETHLSYCFEDSLIFQASFSEIQHLIEKRLSGISPFHSSLFVYIKRKKEFSESKERLNGKTKAWIEQHAPDYWKWGWEWIIEANLGNTAPLLNGITREWLIRSLCNAYPLEHIEHIFDIAEGIAFQKSLYPDLLRLRLLKMRLVDGPEFQVQDFSDFLDCSLSCSPNSFGLFWRADNLRIIPDNEIVIIAKHLQGKNEHIVNGCAKEIYRRIRFYARLGDSNHHQTLSSLVYGYLEVLVSYDYPELERVNEFYERISDKSSSFKRILELLIQYGHRHLLFDLSIFKIPEDLSTKVIDEVVLAARIEGISLEEAPQNLSFYDSSIGLLFLFLAGKDISSEKIAILDCPENHEAATSDLFYQFFFNALVSGLYKSESIEKPDLVESNSIEDFIKNAWLTFQYASFKISETIKANEKVDISVLYSYFSVLELPDQYRLGYKLNSVLFNVRKSLAEITIHLNVLCNSIDEFAVLSEGDFSKISESVWWNSRIFFDVAAQNSIFNFPKSIASKVFDKLFKHELTRRENTAELANDSLELGILAAKHGLHHEAHNFLERAAYNIVGYGHRKDVTFHEVFKAIETCSSANCPQVADWLSRVASFTTDVFEFSEREINHIPGWFIELLSKHNPERLVDELDHHLTQQNWDQAENILEGVVKAFPLSTPEEHSLLRCMTTFVAISALKERSVEDSHLEKIYDEQCKILGGAPPKPRERSASETQEISEFPDVTSIHPTSLDKLKSSLSSVAYQIREQFVTDWIKYWVDQCKGSTILNTFSEYYEGNNSDYELDRCLHEIFLLSKRIEGKAKAYMWAVRDIKLNNCWSPYFSKTHSEKSLKLYGVIYKNDWEKLLRDTISPGISWSQREGTITVPSTQLIIYLTAADQVDLAVEITETMVCSLEGDIAHLPLTELYWYEKPVSLEVAPLHLIYLLYKWPDRYARLQVAKQISSLLEDNGNTEFQLLYLQYLSKQQYEVDVVDYLSILLLVENCPFSKEDIIQKINFPSLLSDELLISLGFIESERADLTIFYSDFSNDQKPNKRKYERYANGLALRWISVIEDLEKKYKAPLLNHFLLEWEFIYERQPCFIFKPYSFCSGLFYPQDKIACSFSWAAEASILSAYIRTLAYASYKHSIPLELCLMHAREVLPFGSLGVSLSPSNPPKNWPRLDDLMKDDPLPSQNELDQYISSLARSDEVLLHANGPILRNHNGVCLDLRVMVVSLDSNEISDPQDIFDSIDNAKNDEEGIFPLAKWTLPSSFGRWETDWLSRGYYRPAYCVANFPVNTVSQDESSVEYFGGTLSNGVWRYWVKHWYPVHRIEVGNSLGTYLTVPKDFFLEFKEQTGSNFYLAAEMICDDHREFGRDEVAIKTYSILPI